MASSAPPIMALVAIGLGNQYTTVAKVHYSSASSPTYDYVGSGGQPPTLSRQVALVVLHGLVRVMQKLVESFFYQIEFLDDLILRSRPPFLTLF